MLKGAPFELVDYFFNEISVARNEAAPWEDESYKPGDGDIALFRDIRFPFAEDDFAIAVQLRLTVAEKQDEQPPVLVTMDLQGLLRFSADSELGIEQKIKVAGVAGSSVLYGVLREQIVSLSSRVVPGGRPFMIPTIAFDPEAVNVEAVLEQREVDQKPE